MIRITESGLHNSRYFSETTGMTYYDSLISSQPLNDFSETTLKDYFKFEKNTEGYIIYMAPKEYMYRCSLIFNTSVEDQYLTVLKELATDYAKQMVAGDKFPIPVLDYKQKTQEGRHRAFAAEQINPNMKMPVLVVDQVFPNKEEYYRYFRTRYGAEVGLKFYQSYLASL